MYRFFTLASLVGAALFSSSLAAGTDAPVIESNPDGCQYIANISKNGITAEIVAETPLDGRGVHFTININGPVLDATNFMYHLHELPVAEDGNCSSTKAHLDPYKRGEDPICDKSNPSSCQVGDLSGKHGDIPTLPGFTTNYTDDFVSLTPGSSAFMGDKSFVLHYPNKTRIACANFELVPKVGDTAWNGTVVGASGHGHSDNGGLGSNSTAPTTSHSTTIPTAISSTTIVRSASSSPTGSALPAEGFAKKTVATRGSNFWGPLSFAIALAVSALLAFWVFCLGCGRAHPPPSD